MNNSLTADTTSTLGHRLVEAIASADRETLLELFAPQLQFRALTPARLFEFDTAEEAVDTMLGKWFGGERRIDGVEAIDCQEFADVIRVGYRFRATTPDGPALVEQQAYLSAEANAIKSIRIVCSGYRSAA